MTLPTWFSPHNFESNRSRLEHCTSVLQIGCYKGDMSQWIMDNTNAHLIDIDTFEGSDDEGGEYIDWDEVKYDYRTRMNRYSPKRWWLNKGTSDDFFSAYEGELFDAIYVDGSHHWRDVLRDAENSHNLLTEGGLLIFDDYEWLGRDDDNPRMGIDLFMAEHGDQYRVITRNTQLWLEKRTYPLKIAVYSPAKNEEHNVRDWYESAKDADEVVLVDTGSTDGTLQVATSLLPDSVLRIAQASIVPWRFDHGFNAALSQVSPDMDIAVPLHLDERLQPGWREALEKAWRAGGNQFLFTYQWSEQLTYRHDRIHSRHGFYWKYPAHECLVGPGPRVDTGVVVVQNRDASKDRSQDQALIHLMLAENPDDSRAQYYSAREHWYHGEWVEARAKFLRYLANPTSTYDQERAEACRYMAKMVYDQYKLKWLLRACSEAPQRREPWADLAVWAWRSGLNDLGDGAAAMANAVTEQTPENSFHCESWCWTEDWESQTREPAVR